MPTIFSFSSYFHPNTLLLFPTIVKIAEAGHFCFAFKSLYAQDYASGHTGGKKLIGISTADCSVEMELTFTFKAMDSPIQHY